MFNLIATMLICLGVANTTPISNNKEEKNQVLTTPKKANITNEYTLTAELTNYSSQNQNVLGTGNSFYTDAQIHEVKANLRNDNSYLNIIGNYYETTYQKVITGDDNEAHNTKFIDNVNYIDSIGLRTCFSYMLKITPYNYNIDTESTIKINVGLYEFTDNNDEDFFAYEIYLKRYVYISTDSSWDQYIGTQLSIEKTNEIKTEIENINNGFYYTETESLTQIGYNNIADIIRNDELELQITPSVDNYYFIVYRPCARFVYNTTEHTQPMLGAIYGNTSGITVTGTNIIPDGTYEIIDIPGLMFEILGMPFAFVSQAFNLTLFPGTPYQINIANLFLSIIAIFVFVWLLLLFIKMKSGG